MHTKTSSRRRLPKFTRATSNPKRGRRNDKREVGGDDSPSCGYTQLEESRSGLQAGDSDKENADFMWNAICLGLWLRIRISHVVVCCCAVMYCYCCWMRKRALLFGDLRWNFFAYVRTFDAAYARAALCIMELNFINLCTRYNVKCAFFDKPCPNIIWHCVWDPQYTSESTYFFPRSSYAINWMPTWWFPSTESWG